MRTKQTGGGGRAHKTSQVNGTPIKKSPPTQDVRSPSQPHELSEKDRAKLKQFLEKSDKPFSVTTVPLTKKRKRTSTPLLVQSDLFEDRLSVQYEIKPANNWECLRRYKKFTVGSESIAVGECILVKHDTTEDPKIDVSAQWKAKVLEVRALDPEHVYIRVSWLNRPEDLETGRKGYHGKNELIPTNQLDIIDAMAVNGRLEVYHWQEADDDSLMPGIEEHFWRQTFDFANTKTFSKLRQICVDQAPQNPDEMILQCGNEECRKWMHLHCIAESAAQRAAGDIENRKPVSKRKSKTKKLALSPPAVAIAQKDSHIAEVFIKGSPNGPNDTPADETKIVLTDEDGTQTTENVHCLICNTAIE